MLNAAATTAQTPKEKFFRVFSAYKSKQYSPFLVFENKWRGLAKIVAILQCQPYSCVCTEDEPKQLKTEKNYQQLNTALQFPGNRGKENCMWHICANPHTVVCSVLHILDKYQGYFCSQVLLPSCGCLILQWKQENSFLTCKISWSLIYIAYKCNFSWHKDSCLALQWEKNNP